MSITARMISTAAVVIVALCPATAHAQDTTQLPAPPEVTTLRTEYTRLDHVRSRTRAIFGKGGSLDCSLVELRNLDTDEVLYGVEVTIVEKDTEVIAQSLGLSNIGSLWGVSTAQTVANIEKNGHIFLQLAELEEVIAFLNQVIGATGKLQRQYKVYKISVNERLELGMIYDPAAISDGNRTDRWSFVVTVDDASYALEYVEGLDVMQGLNRFTKQIRNLNERPNPGSLELPPPDRLAAWVALEEGQTQREATALLGEPLSARIQDGYTLLIYDDGEVRIENGVVVSWTR